MTSKNSPALSLLIADQALLENLARTVEYRDKAAADVAKGGMHIAQAAQRVSEYGFKADALLEVVRASGAARRHEALVETALAGDEHAVFEYFFDLRYALKDAEQA